MATYAVGDIQGCFHSFQSLLKRIQFNPTSDKLWLVGDLINRGSGSLEVLRWVFEHQSSIVTVLGNHDLHTLVVAEGFVSAHRSDTIKALLDAPDADELLSWLRHQPLLHFEHDCLMVHAGLLPQWTAAKAQSLAQEVHQALSADNYREFLKHMYGNQPVQWDDALTGYDRLRLITNAMTRLRVCTQAGEMEFNFKGELASLPLGFLPWFELEDRVSADTTIVFGHWSAIGLRQTNNVYALDTGCLWGGALTAIRLEDKAVFQVPCHVDDAPINMHFTD
ncbi:MAG: symmetrical bis(5'-nucleosyl)-tetraphosphatase [Candidatus Methylopumilus sp.]|jgi:bis(5'-nucleosyl)-tetraphosphatase (symmetrical)|nr:symmetrical bis(5'-nucleosyl)-tetraphosphatase [Candidatus Methylopumilus sp.]